MHVKNGGDAVLNPTHGTQDVFNILLNSFAQENVAEYVFTSPTVTSISYMRYINQLNTVCGLPLCIHRAGESSPKGSSQGM